MKTWTTKNGQRIDQLLGGRCNAFLVSRGDRCILVDSGRTSQRRRLYRRLKGISPHKNPPAALIMTHTHFDHAENAAALKERYGTRIVVNKREAEKLASGTSPSIHGSLFLTGFLTERMADRFMSHCPYTPADPDVLIDEHYDLSEWGINGYILYTPGHTVGSMSVIIDDEIAIVGDALCGIFRGSVYPPFAHDETVMVQSWGKLLETGCSTFLPGHGTADGRELVLQQYEKHRGRK
ncbi:MAG: MBL fold metallo-hydrolase [Syntrophales bacterium]|nr:MBL fold metallo-hydrolase [Syntrophales bacterium]